MPRVSKICVARLYNLGNYEHVRYELTVEVPEGESAAQAICGVEHILAGLRPAPDLETEYEIAQYEARLQELKTQPDEVFVNKGLSKGDVIASAEKNIYERKCKREALLQRAKAAREFFDDLGGAAKWEDAKDKWETGDY